MFKPVSLVSGGGMVKNQSRQKTINNALDEVRNDPMKAQALAMELMKKGIKKI